MQIQRLACFLVLLLIGNSQKTYAQFIGGETVYKEEVEGKSLERPAPGVRLYLISGQYDPSKGLPPDSRLLDQDISASPSAGDPPQDSATFVLISKENHPKVTILFYPYSRDGEPVSPGLLSRIVIPKVTEKDGLLRAKVRINCTPTNKKLGDVRSVLGPLHHTYAASQVARAAGFKQEVLERNFRYEVSLIRTMIDPEKADEILPKVMVTIEKDRLFGDFAGDCQEMLSLTDNELSKLRSAREELWGQLLKTNPTELDFGFNKR